MPRKDGSRLSQHVALLKRQGLDVSEFTPPPLPRQLAHVWRWFGELCAGRGSGEAGYTAISYSEILAWSQLRGIRIGNYELGCLRDLDIIFLRTNSNG